MLTIAIALQNPSGEKTDGLSEPPGVLMSRFVAAARTWVTTNDEMHGTVDCLVCIILEGVYEMNSGNLRRAWAVFRRAMSVAQLMGLHRSPMPPLKRIDADLDADPEFLWFRIVYLDRHLSLLLGLPQGTSEKSMAAAAAMRNEPALGRFERHLTVVASRILERNESPFPASQAPATQAIDAELLQVAGSMPASFWRAPDFHRLTPGSPETLLETQRLAAHVYYHGLLIQLHLPFMLRVGDNAVDEYSKITCVNSSREIMSRFIAHRTFNPSSSCSRPVDFFALLAAMTLLLAHLDAHHHRGPTSILAHQRLTDRAMLDQALERMDAIKTRNRDVTTAKSAELIRRLLDIEADAAAGGGSCSAARSAGGSGGDKGPKHGEELRLTIPYLGVIRIGRQGAISRELPADVSAQDRPRTSSQLGTAATEAQALGLASATQSAAPWSGSEMQCPSSTWDNPTLPSMADGVDGVDDWVFQGVDTAFFDGLLRGTAALDAAVGFDASGT
ncbi:e9376411-14ad-4d01-b409-2305fa411a95 [Thermothielavioides terrestris]|uniref:E9376411-14ad-4d01-b409-2305fa411a95 n=1 Tax=Thermothielavioides terrestris TaxID=2587410 RepID=A0A446BKN7_9PEZI|nr:e9376411-14ad-4d01-b409-2305fa411a95 [Thermothielavioides terrestris]